VVNEGVVVSEGVVVTEAHSAAITELLLKQRVPGGMSWAVAKPLAQA